MKISVAMATHNAGAYLDEQLTSIANQSLQPDELVVYDDASQDDTCTTLIAFTERVDFEVRILRGETPLGVARSFNMALEGTTGDLVLLADQDDYWYEQKISIISDYLRANSSILLAIHDLDFCDQNLVPIGQTKLNRMRMFADPHAHYVTGMATAVTRELLDVCLPVPEDTRIAHDDWLHWCARMLSGKSVVPISLAAYRRHGTNATGKKALNVSTKVGPIHFLRTALRDVRTPGFDPRELWVSRLTAEIAWLQDRGEDITRNGLMSETSLRCLLEEWQAKRRVVEARGMRLTWSSPRRSYEIAIALAAGEYKYFGGWRSALLDSLTPRLPPLRSEADEVR